MTEQYKIGDKVLVEAKIESFDYSNECWVTLIDSHYKKQTNLVPLKCIQKYRFENEFENGETVEFGWSKGAGLIYQKAKFVGKDNKKTSFYNSGPYIVNPINPENGRIEDAKSVNYVYKLGTNLPTETVEFGNKIFNRIEFESAIKNLKPLEDL
mgnify:FL=1